MERATDSDRGKGEARVGKDRTEGLNHGGKWSEGSLGLKEGGSSGCTASRCEFLGGGLLAFDGRGQDQCKVSIENQIGRSLGWASHHPEAPTPNPGPQRKLKDLERPCPISGVGFSDQRSLSRSSPLPPSRDSASTPRLPSPGVGGAALWSLGRNGGVPQRLPTTSLSGQLLRDVSSRAGAASWILPWSWNRGWGPRDQDGKTEAP